MEEINENTSTISVPETVNQNGEEEVISNTKNTTSEPETQNFGSNEERIRLELEAYQKHFLALNEELAEIRKKYQDPEAAPPDPVTLLSGDVSDLKNEFDEIKKMILQQQQRQQDQAPQMQQQGVQHTIPQGQTQPQMMYQNPFMPFVPQIQPMFQTSTIMPAPTLPYLATPPLIPTNTQVPQFNYNNDNRR